jgi:hypothetical protein
MMRDSGVSVDNLSNRAATSGGEPSQPGPHGDRYASPNAISFPRPVSSLRPAANCDPSSDRPFILDDDACALCAMGVVVGSVAVAIGLLLFAGVEIFGLFDLG